MSIAIRNVGVRTKTSLSMTTSFVAGSVKDSGEGAERGADFRGGIPVWEDGPMAKLLGRSGRAWELEVVPRRWGWRIRLCVLRLICTIQDSGSMDTRMEDREESVRFAGTASYLQYQSRLDRQQNPHLKSFARVLSVILQRTLRDDPQLPFNKSSCVYQTRV